MLPWATYFPDPIVRLGPVFCQPLQEAVANAPALVEWSESGFAGLEQGIEQFTVYIQLPLPVGRVPDPNWP
jgi:hypothetical protein